MSQIYFIITCHKKLMLLLANHVVTTPLMQSMPRVHLTLLQVT